MHPLKKSTDATAGPDWLLVILWRGYESSGEHLESHLQLGRPLGVAGGLVAGPLDVHGHGEDRSVHGARLGQQAVLEARVDLVQAHQGVHGVVGVGHPPVQD